MPLTPDFDFLISTQTSPPLPISIFWYGVIGDGDIFTSFTDFTDRIFREDCKTVDVKGSHSEHLGDEILNLRNTLLQSELERERIALELEEEKKAQAERDKMLQESGELTEVKAEYEKLLMEFEAERTMNKIQIDNLTRRLADATSCLDEEPRVSYTSNSDISLTELEASIQVLEKALSLQNLESVVELETEKDKEASNKYEKLYMELMAAKEEACLEMLL
ncbi:hypothetical protein LXL04_023841 [Taraxacum kok-saghyz]